MKTKAPASPGDSPTSTAHVIALTPRFKSADALRVAEAAGERLNRARGWVAEAVNEHEATLKGIVACVPMDDSEREALEEILKSLEAWREAGDAFVRAFSSGLAR